MTVFTISLAGFPIRVEALHESTANFCRDYLTDEEPVFTVRMEQRDIDWERENAARERALEGLEPREYSERYLESLAVYRRIASLLLERDVLLFHGCVMACEGRAYLFTAPSGTGKTTHCRLWLDRFPGSHVLNGDKPLLRIEEERVLACGTPWQGKERYGCNEILPLEAICFLERDTVNHIAPVSFHDAFPALLAQTHRPAGGAAMLKTLALLEKLGQRTRLYRLGCNMEPEAAELSFTTMHGDRKP